MKTDLQNLSTYDLQQLSIKLYKIRLRAIDRIEWLQNSIYKLLVTKNNAIKITKWRRELRARKHITSIALSNIYKVNDYLRCRMNIKMRSKS